MTSLTHATLLHQSIPKYMRTQTFANTFAKFQMHSDSVAIPLVSSFVLPDMQRVISSNDRGALDLRSSNSRSLTRSSERRRGADGRR